MVPKQPTPKIVGDLPPSPMHWWETVWPRTRAHFPKVRVGLCRGKSVDCLAC